MVQRKLYIATNKIFPTTGKLYCNPNVYDQVVMRKKHRKNNQQLSDYCSMDGHKNRIVELPKFRAYSVECTPSTKRLRWTAVPGQIVVSCICACEKMYWLYQPATNTPETRLYTPVHEKYIGRVRKSCISVLIVSHLEQLMSYLNRYLLFMNVLIWITS